MWRRGGREEIEEVEVTGFSLDDWGSVVKTEPLHESLNGAAATGQPVSGDSIESGGVTARFDDEEVLGASPRPGIEDSSRRWFGVKAAVRWVVLVGAIAGLLSTGVLANKEAEPNVENPRSVVILTNDKRSNAQREPNWVTKLVQYRPEIGLRDLLEILFIIDQLVITRLRQPRRCNVSPRSGNSSR